MVTQKCAHWLVIMAQHGTAKGGSLKFIETRSLHKQVERYDVGAALNFLRQRAKAG